HHTTRISTYQHLHTRTPFTLSLHAALPISSGPPILMPRPRSTMVPSGRNCRLANLKGWVMRMTSPFKLASRQFRPEGTIVDLGRSEEHTSELQSRGHLVCRLLPEKKKTSST